MASVILHRRGDARVPLWSDARGFEQADAPILTVICSKMSDESCTQFADRFRKPVDELRLFRDSNEAAGNQSEGPHDHASPS
jgi:hypothetical protein